MKILTRSRRHAGIAAAQRPALRWRASWCASKPFIWGAAMATSPTVWAVAAMLGADARCDHPVFWWGLPCAVALANALAISHLKSRHHQGACHTRRAAGRAYFAAALPLTLLLVLLLGWDSGFLADMAPLAMEWMHQGATSLLSTACAVAVSLVFAAGSHLLSAAVLPWLAMTMADADADADAGKLPDHSISEYRYRKN
ncbi:MAG: hypothetical protein GAK35_01641 [Herbaspirillum frisingense]|uniref:Uncharacterized protein n=1 Tax=Herbaspirillum frisingense TaxID=92645 RepID=A0A7V8JUZ2_9BURK|nr:MAG: hypothetical protein GAK35_01641 [Herbaspirillum frisingense]